MSSAASRLIPIRTRSSSPSSSSSLRSLSSPSCVALALPRHPPKLSSAYSSSYGAVIPASEAHEADRDAQVPILIRSSSSSAVGCSSSRSTLSSKVFGAYGLALVIATALLLINGIIPGAWQPLFSSKQADNERIMQDENNSALKSGLSSTALRLHSTALTPTAFNENERLAISSSASSFSLLASSSSDPFNCSCNPPTSEDSGTSSSSESVYIILSCICVLMGAIMSGLQVGMFSIDPLKLEVLRRDENTSKEDRRRAELLVPLLAKHHWLLVTLLVVNAVAMEALPIFLDDLVPSYIAIILSVTVVLIFGEIIPQALFTSDPLKLDAAMAPVVKVLMWVCAPIAWPLSKVLDRLLGDEGGSHFLFKRTELNALVDLHAASEGGHLHNDAVAIMQGALNYGEKTVSEVMTAFKEVFMIECSQRLDWETLNEIFTSGYSRIPVFDRMKPSHDNIIGLLIVKDLILLDPHDAVPISTILNLFPRPLDTVFPDTSLQEMLETFKGNRTHIALVHEVVNEEEEEEANMQALNKKSVRANGHNAAAMAAAVSEGAMVKRKCKDPYYRNVGIITLEDIIEEILKTDIVDENESEWAARIKLAKRFGHKRRFTQKLSPQEFALIFYHVQSNFGVFRSLSESGLKRVIADSLVVDVRVGAADFMGKTGRAMAAQAHANSAGGASNGGANGSRMSLGGESEDPRDVFIESGGRMLYRRGVPSDYFTLIIDGTVEVRAGADGFLSEARRWAGLATTALEPHADEIANEENEKPEQIFAEADSPKAHKSTEESKTPVLSSSPDPTAAAVPLRSATSSTHLSAMNRRTFAEHGFSYVADFSAVAVSDCRLLRVDRRRLINELRKEKGLSAYYEHQIQRTVSVRDILGIKDEGAADQAARPRKQGKKKQVRMNEEASTEDYSDDDKEGDEQYDDEEEQEDSKAKAREKAHDKTKKVDSRRKVSGGLHRSPNSATAPDGIELQVLFHGEESKVTHAQVAEFAAVDSSAKLLTPSPSPLALPGDSKSQEDKSSVPLLPSKNSDNSASSEVSSAKSSPAVDEKTEHRSDNITTVQIDATSAPSRPAASELTLRPVSVAHRAYDLSAEDDEEAVDLLSHRPMLQHQSSRQQQREEREREKEREKASADLGDHDDDA